MPDTHPTPRPYAPLYFLASLGNGGLAVTFFMYLMFWVPHPGHPVPVYEDIAAAIAAGDLAARAMIIVAALGIAIFSFQNLRRLVWHLRSLSAYRTTPAFEKLTSSNAETQLLALPLALAMSVNVGFILGLVFVPGLWGIVEYLFPAAMVAFGLIGVLALRQIGHFLARILSEGGIFDVTAHNSFAQLMPAFALAMVAVGFAAPAAMSGTTLTVGASLLLSTAFGVTAAVYGVLAAVTALNSMLHYGTAKESGPTLMVIVPILTVLGIMVLRQDHGMHTTFEAHGAAVDTMMFLAKVLTVQLIFAALGLLVMNRQGYFGTYVWGETRSPGSYALVCPGVALSVMLHFFINKGLVGAGMIEKFGLAYWSFSGLAVALQIATIGLVVVLNRHHFAGVGVAPQAQAH